MVKLHKRAGEHYRLAGVALCLIAAGCTDSSRTEPLSRLQGAPRVQDVYQNTSPEVVRYDRYTLASTRPADAQRDPLNQIIEIRMPQQVVRTVGEGLRYLLLESGYSLCNGDATVFAELFSKPLPAVQRSVGPVRLTEALQVLAGPAWRLHVDDVNREVCFVLRDQYRRFTPALVMNNTALPATTGNSTSTAARNPFRNSSTVVSGGTQSLSQPLPVPSLQSRPASMVSAPVSTPQGSAATVKTPLISSQKAARSGLSTDGLFSGTHSSAPVAVPSATSRAPVAPLSGKPSATPSLPATNSTTTTAAVKPTTALPPAPAPSAVKSTLSPSPVFSSGTQVSAAPAGKEWRAEPGTTLKETVIRWASEARCDNGRQWEVFWPMKDLDYPIDAPLSLRGNFESAIMQLFELYREARRPLFVRGIRVQCLIMVSDKPVQGGN